ncbi:MAG TPA: TlyA family RNA methyltransferase [Nitrospiraceae bacterium]|nr:TlyA family RNA methyltransferase [Nitrospiraceae bacterium]
MTQKSSRDRLDRTLVSRGLVESREQAGRLILAGVVSVDGVPVDKQAKLVSTEARIEITSRPIPFVSRGGVKLAAALDAFQVDAAGLVAMDVGASTGGFTDCLLQRGARLIYAVDVGYGQLDWRLRQDPRVVVLERRNIRYLEPSSVPDRIDLAVIDVSFISLDLVLPCVVRFLRRPAFLIALIKPQFEVGRGQVGRGGIVRDQSLREAVTKKVLRSAQAIGLTMIGVCDSPISGQKGNREILAGFQFADGSVRSAIEIDGEEDVRAAGQP